MSPIFDLLGDPVRGPQMMKDLMAITERGVSEIGSGWLRAMPDLLAAARAYVAETDCACSTCTRFRELFENALAKAGA